MEMLSNLALGFETALTTTNLDLGIRCKIKADVKRRIDDATKFIDFEGKRIAFCCDNCPKAFAADPAKFKDKIK